MGGGGLAKISPQKVLKIDENHAEVYNRRATNLMLKGCMQEAAADIQKARIFHIIFMYCILNETLLAFG